MPNCAGSTLTTNCIAIQLWQSPPIGGDPPATTTDVSPPANAAETSTLSSSQKHWLLPSMNEQVFAGNATVLPSKIVLPKSSGPNVSASGASWPLPTTGYQVAVTGNGPAVKLISVWL